MQLYLLVLFTFVLLIIIAILYFMYRKLNHLSVLVNQLLNDMLALQTQAEANLYRRVLPNQFLTPVMSAENFLSNTDNDINIINHPLAEEEVDSSEDSSKESSAE